MAKIKKMGLSVSVAKMGVWYAQIRNNAFNVKQELTLTKMENVLRNAKVVSLQIDKR